MIRTLAIGLLTGLYGALACAALQAGEPAPAFQAQASLDGKAFRYALQDGLKNGPVVVYFFPAAYTKGCNMQAHGFAVAHDEFKAAGASIVGVSLDGIARLNSFSADPEYCAGKIAVASDADGRISRAYGLHVSDAAPGRKDTRGAEIAHGLAERTTFVVDRDGRIAATVGGLEPEENVRQALEAVRRLAQAQR